MRAGGTAAGSAVAALMHRPFFEERLSDPAGIDLPGKVATARRAAVACLAQKWRPARAFQVSQEPARIRGMHHPVAVAVEDEHRQLRGQFACRLGPAPRMADVAERNDRTLPAVRPE